MRNPSLSNGRLSSDVIGMHTGIAPMVRPRPPTPATIMLQNPAVRDGYVSSEPIGLHTGVRPRKTSTPSERVRLPATRNDRPTTTPVWMTTMRTSDAIGTHPPPEKPDMNDAAQMHFEAQFMHRFGDSNGQLGSVLSSGAITEAAAEFQKQWVERARQLSTKKIEQVGLSRSQSMRADGEMMEKMDFDSVYSNLHTSKDTQSAIGKDFIPTLDPRTVATRPKDLEYGSLHTVKTTRGPRAPLPSRSFMAIGAGPGRSVDF